MNEGTIKVPNLQDRGLPSEASLDRLKNQLMELFSISEDARFADKEIKARISNSICLRPEFELLVEPEINIFLYRYIPEPWRQKVAKGQLTEYDNKSINQFNELLQHAQRQAGNTFVSRTTLETTCYGRGKSIVALRAVLANPLTSNNALRGGCS